MRRVLQSLAAGFVVYVVVVACASSEPSGRPPTPQFEAGVSGAGGQQGAGGAAGVGQDASLLDAHEGGLLDALLDPVPEAKADVTTSGSRLKASWYVGADGSRQFKEWWDSEIGHRCSFSTATDGETRCLPLSQPAGELFADNACTQRIVASPQGCPPPSYAYWVQSQSQGCGTLLAYEVYEVGAQVTPAAIYQGTACNDVTAAYASQSFYAASVRPPSDFVAATVETDP